MNLRDYLVDRGITAAEFGARIGVTDESVRRYTHGSRYPRPEIMRRIVAVTEGAVGPQDFLDAAATAEEFRSARRPGLDGLEPAPSRPRRQHPPNPNPSPEPDA